MMPGTPRFFHERLPVLLNEYISLQAQTDRESKTK